MNTCTTSLVERDSVMHNIALLVALSAFCVCLDGQTTSTTSNVAADLTFLKNALKDVTARLATLESQMSLLQLAINQNTAGKYNKGTKGDPGNPGKPGIPGDTITGPRGPKGDRGLQGPTGPQGPYGQTGAQGRQGLAGPTGSNGLPGPPGTMGLTGLPGTIGPRGDKGVQGERGSDGSKGEQGAPGDVGLQGRDGPQGLQGVKGSTGPVGSIGPPGPPGLRGVKGDSGIDGQPGLQGPPGQQGLKGAVGPIGQPGLPGAGGPQGVTGQQGHSGQTGLPGPPGQQGPKGDPGRPGPVGLQGAPQAGMKGDDGLNAPADMTKLTQDNTGFNYSSAGLPGEKGLKGDPGPMGPRGDVGPPGVCDCSQSVDNSTRQQGLNRDTNTNPDPEIIKCTSTWTSYIGQYTHGAVLHPKYTTEDSCKFACVDLTPSCIAAELQSMEGGQQQCYLHTTLYTTKPMTRTAKLDTTQFVLTARCPFAVCVTSWVNVTDAQFTSNNGNVLQPAAINESDCLSLCVRTPSCVVAEVTRVTSTFACTFFDEEGPTSFSAGHNQYHLLQRCP